MNLLRLALAELRARAVNTALTVVLLALGLATVVVILLVSGQLEERLKRDAAGIDLVVGPKGSATQLVLSSVYHLDAPAGTLPWAAVERLRGDLAVRTAIPVALGDSYWGFRIVGTTQDYLSHYRATLASGRTWQAPLEAVLGADVALRMRSTLGSTFVAGHGLQGARDALHSGQPYRVVGILARTGTVIDRVIVTDIASTTRIHHPDVASEPATLVSEPPQEDAPDLSAILVQTVSPDATAQLVARLSGDYDVQAAAPEAELRRLFRFIGVGREVLWGFAIVLMFAAGVSVFIALYDALVEHRREIAIMRVLGAGPRRVMALLLLEGVILALMGALFGLLLGHGLTSLLGIVLNRGHQVSVTGWTWDPWEISVIAFAVAVGFLAALGPAWRARRIDIAATLAR